MESSSDRGLRPRRRLPAIPDSQDATCVSQRDVSSATCPVCSRSTPLTKSGALRIHGPLSNHCKGSGMLMLITAEGDAEDSEDSEVGMSRDITASASPRRRRLISETPLGQDAGPARQPSCSICPVCSRSMPLTRSGDLRIHGPLHNRCGGSGMHPGATAPPTAEDRASSSGLTISFEILQSVRVLKKIPRATRHLTARKLAVVLEDIVKKNDSPSWECLFKFSRRCLAQPRRGGHRRSLASAVKHQVEEEADPEIHTVISHPRSSDPMHLLAKRVSTKLEGDYKGAVRIVCSDESIAENTDETISALKAKHPDMHPEANIPSPPLPRDFLPSEKISEDAVRSTIHSFSRGSAAGPDGIRPQHLVDLTCASAEHGGRELLHALTDFVNHVIQGDIPQSVRPIFFGANLTPLRKKDGGIRPIAVDQSLRRLMAKCVSSRVSKSLGAELRQHSLGLLLVALR